MGKWIGPRILLRFAISVLFVNSAFAQIDTATVTKANPQRSSKTRVSHFFSIERFRFHNHSEQHFERLVIEFQEAKPSAGTPMVKVTKAQGSQPASVDVLGITLIGAIPESSINHAFLEKSKRLKQLNFQNDLPQLLTIKLAFKHPSFRVHAFWIKTPHRLVIDVFDRKSRQVPRLVALKTDPSLKNHAADWFCFGAESKIQAQAEQPSTTQPKDGKSLMVTLESQATPSRTPSTKNVSCFPKSAMLPVKIQFKPPHSVASSVPTNVPVQREKTENTAQNIPSSQTSEKKSDDEDEAD